jgi:hypothetical protein
MAGHPVPMCCSTVTSINAIVPDEDSGRHVGWTLDARTNPSEALQHRRSARSAEP